MLENTLDNNLDVLNEYKNINIVHKGKIYFNLNLFCTLICFLPVFTLLFNVVATLTLTFIGIIMFLAILFTFGGVFAIFENYWQKIVNVFNLITKIGDFVNKTSVILVQICPLFSSLSVIFAILSIALLSKDKRQKHTAKKIFSLLFVIASILILVVYSTKEVGV